MQHRIDKEIILPQATVQLMTVSWQGVGQRPQHSDYSLFQRLSDDHSPLRIGSRMTPELLPRTRSVGFLPPNASFKMLPLEKPLRILYCSFNPAHVEAVTELTDSDWMQYLPQIATIRNTRLELLMQELHAELTAPQWGSKQLVEGVCDLALIELRRHLEHVKLSSPAEHNKQPLAKWQLKMIDERIRDLSDSNYPSTQELAQLCGISVSHLSRTFKASTGWPLHQYIAETRVAKAKELLTHTSMSCEQIAHSLGFKSASYFSAYFKRITHLNPKAYRQFATQQD